MRYLRKGSVGQDVKQLQSRLNEVQGSGLLVDGWFGAITEKAVKNFQARNNLLIDGIVGSKTYQALGMLKRASPKYLVIHVSATPERVAGYDADMIVRYHLSPAIPNV